jgi:hypothetical protein
MIQMRSPSRRLLPAMLLAIAAGCSTPADGDSRRASDIVRDLMRLTDPLDDPADPEERLRKSTYSRYGLGFLDEPTWLLKMPAEEALLVEVGSAAAPPILAALADVRSHRTLKVRLAQLAAKFPDPQIAPELCAIARNEADPLVRLCLVQSIALLDAGLAANLARDLIKEDRLPRHLDQWCLAMAGDKPARSRYFDFFESLLRSEELEPAGSESTPTLATDPSGKHLYVRARKTGMLARLDLYLEVWRLAQLRDLRTVDALIRSLGFHDPPTQHVAIHFLCRDVSAPVELRQWTDYDLHSLTCHHRWSNWWNERRNSMTWVESDRKYLPR